MISKATCEVTRVCSDDVLWVSGMQNQPWTAPCHVGIVWISVITAASSCKVAEMEQVEAPKAGPYLFAAIL